MCECLKADALSVYTRLSGGVNGPTCAIVENLYIALVRGTSTGCGQTKAQTCCANIGANNLTAAAFVAKAALGK